MTVDRRRLLAGLAAAAPLSLLGATAQAQAPWPQQTVRIISPYGPGGPNDISARLFADRFGKRMGQSFFVENKAGAGTRLASELVAQAPADGYTLLYAAAPFAVAESLYGKLGYDPGRDFQPVTLAVVTPVFLIVNAELPVKSVAEFIKYAKSKPQGINIASPGAGSGPHLTGELFMKEAGIQGLSVHFRGDVTAYTELLAGRVDATVSAISAALPHVKAGKLRVLAVANETRSPVEPNAPTFAEAGFPNIVGYGWFGFIVPNGTPAATVNRLAEETNAVLKEPEFSRQALALGLQARGGTPAESADFIQNEKRKWGEVIRAGGIKAE